MRLSGRFVRAVAAVCATVVLLAVAAPAQAAGAPASATSGTWVQVPPRTATTGQIGRAHV